MQDTSAEIQSAVRYAIDRSSPLSIQGNGSKSFYGRKPQGRILSVSAHTGILNYQPTELVITARCGTPLEEIENALDAQGQMLGFEPPHFGVNPTLGGTVATGLSGPRRPFSGSVRDFVLGCRIINGRGEILSFGGEVMKNVAGYDLSRLMAGSLGTLAVILDISFKVVPRPEIELTLRQEMDDRQALDKMSQWRTKPLPISALTWMQGAVYIRLSGGQHAVTGAKRILGGELLENDSLFWSEMRDHQHRFFQQTDPLWRISLESTSPILPLSGNWIYDWGGEQRWLQSTCLPETVFKLANSVGGHATLFRSQGNREAIFQPLSKQVASVQARVKDAFDPNRIFNPGRMYPEW